MRARSILALVVVAIGVVVGWTWSERGGSAASSSDAARASAPAPEAPLAPTNEPDPSSAAVRDALMPAAVESAPNQVDVSDDTRLRGRVVGPDGQPIAGAQVELQRCGGDGFGTLDLVLDRDAQRQDSATTAADGSFAFEVAPGRPFRLLATSPPFVPALRTLCRSGEFVEIALARSAEVFGRVTRASDGSPVAEARVRVFQRRRDDEAGVSNRAHVVTTDAGGSYRVGDLAPGSWYLDVQPKVEAAPHWSEIELAAGERREKDLTVVAGIELRGRVVDAETGLPIAEAEVAQSWTFERVVRTGADGTYLYPGFSAGYAELSARAEGYGRQELAVDADQVTGETRFDFLLSRARRIRGRVVDEAGLPVRATYVAVAATTWSNSTGAQPIDWCSAFSAEAGTFELRNVRPDMSHALVLRKDGYGYAVYDLPASERESLQVELGDVVLPPASSVAGRIVDDRGAPIAGRPVHLCGSHAARRRYSGEPTADRSLLDSYVAERTARSGADGHFAFADVAEGAYTLRVDRPGSHEVVSKPVEVPRAAAAAEVEIVLPSGTSIAGRVRAPDDGELPIVYISVDPQKGGAAGDVRVEPDGSFHAPGLTDGSIYTLSVYPYSRSDERRFLPSVVRDIASGRQDVEIVLRGGGLVRGRVVDRDGLPVARASVASYAPDGEWLASAETAADGTFGVTVLLDQLCDLRVTRPLSDGEPRSAAGEAGVRADRIAAGTSGLELRLDGPP